MRSYSANSTRAYTYFSPLFPNPVACFEEIFGHFKDEVPKRILGSENTSWSRETWEWHYSAFYVQSSDFMNIILIALALTLMRICLNKLLFQRIPKWLKILEHDALKFPESAWKCLVYICTWSYIAYFCMISEEHKYFYYLERHWNEWTVGVKVPPEIYWIYVFEMGFYVHCLYATIFIETIRKDFVLLILHHVLTFGLLIYSYGVRYYGIGMLVMFFHDFGDVMLEVSKCIVYLKTRNGKECKITEFVSNVSFGIFLIQWIIFRLYWFLTKAIYSSAVVNTKIYKNGPFYLSFNVMLSALYAMQVYWFYMIMKVVKKIIVGEGMVDTRETDEELKAWRSAMEKEPGWTKRSLKIRSEDKQSSSKFGTEL